MSSGLYSSVSADEYVFSLQVNSPSLMRPGSVEQYKRAFARQRARDLAQHADVLLSKDKEIAALQQECRELEARLGITKVFITHLLLSKFIQPRLKCGH